MITTHSHRQIDLYNFREEDVDIQDIAHALSLCNRFAGHTSFPISVAQHSVMVCRVVAKTESKTIARQALLHDASEAYLGDVTKWLKESPVMEAYRRLEAQIQRTIYQKFECPVSDDGAVIAADKLMVRAEASFGGLPIWNYNKSYLPPTHEELKKVGHWRPMHWTVAKESFLREFETCAP